MSCSGCLKIKKYLPPDAMCPHVLLASEVTWPNLTSEELGIESYYVTRGRAWGLWRALASSPPPHPRTNPKYSSYQKFSKQEGILIDRNNGSKEPRNGETTQKSSRQTNSIWKSNGSSFYITVLHGVHLSFKLENWQKQSKSSGGDVSLPF